MSKLYRLKEFFTLEEAAKRISTICEEDVQVKDVLKLALDGHLRLSVDFINHTFARHGKIAFYSEEELMAFIVAGTLPEDLKWMKFPANMFPGLIDTPNIGDDRPVVHLMSLNLGDGRYLTLDKDVSSIDGVWDLAMVGGELIAVQNAFQRLTGGPEVTLTAVDGTFVQRGDEQVCQLQAPFNDLFSSAGPESKTGVTQSFIEKMKARLSPANYYSTGFLPEDCVLVVRRQALDDLEQRINEMNSPADPVVIEKPFSTRQRGTLLKLVVGMAIKGFGYDHRAARSAAPKTISDDIAMLGIDISDDTIRGFLDEASKNYLSKNLV